METKKSGDIEVTLKLLEETRGELKSDITAVRLKVKSGFEKVDGLLQELRSDIKARFGSMEANLEKVLAAVHHS